MISHTSCFLLGWRSHMNGLSYFSSATSHENQETDGVWKWKIMGEQPFFENPKTILGLSFGWRFKCVELYPNQCIYPTRRTATDNPIVILCGWPLGEGSNDQGFKWQTGQEGVFNNCFSACTYLDKQSNTSKESLNKQTQQWSHWDWNNQSVCGDPYQYNNPDGVVNKKKEAKGYQAKSNQLVHCCGLEYKRVKSQNNSDPPTELQSV